MENKHIVITGAGGQLGTELKTYFPSAKALHSNELDISDQSAIESYDWTDVGIIINAAAYTDVDGAESPNGRVSAWRVNADGAANLVAAAAQHDITLVHVSTDYVFDGTKEVHTESETFSPLSSYGASKAAGDLAVSLAPKHYVIRTSWVIGDGKNFVRTMLRVGEKGINPTVVADQIGRLTFTTELVRAIDHLLSNDCKYGTYNVSNCGDSASWAEITRTIFGLAGYDLSVTDTTTAEYFIDKEGIAPRPLQSTLDLTRIQSTGFKSRDWKDDLTDYIKKETRNESRYS